MTDTNTCYMPEVTVWPVEDGFMVHVRPRGGKAVYVAHGAQIVGLPVFAIKCEEGRQSLVRAQPVVEIPQ